MREQPAHYENKLRWEMDSRDFNHAREQSENIVVIEARRAERFAAKHIPGAVNLHHMEMDEAATAGFDPDALYVTYCDGIGCNASTKGAWNMVRPGFRIRELIGGLDWWKRDGYPTKTGPASTGPGCAC